MPDVFISHSSHDKSKAEQLASELGKFGLTAFLDCISIKPGADWTATIYQNLNSSPVVLLLATKNAITSATVNQEVGWAMKQGCTIVPIVWDMKPEELPPWVARYQAVVLTGKTEPEIKDQLTGLMKHLADQKQQRAVATLAILGFALWVILSK